MLASTKCVHYLCGWAKEYQEDIRRWERESTHGMNTHFCHLGWQPRYGNPHMWSVLVVCPRGIPLGGVNESSVLLHGLTFQIYPTKIASTLMIFLVPNDNNHKCKQWVKNLFLPRPKCTPEHQGVNRLSSDQIKHAMEWNGLDEPQQRSRSAKKRVSHVPPPNLSNSPYGIRTR